MSDNTGAQKNSTPPATAAGTNPSTPPVNITELEIALARDPGSDAFIPLCDAYIAQNRFMEAMVLGKKAVKAKPEDKVRRLLLARVYAEQGKMPKAIEEVNALLKVDPNHSPSHVALGRYLEKDNKKDLAITSFKAAVDLDDNADARAALSALGISYEKPKPPPPPPPPVAPAMTPAPTAARPRPRTTGSLAAMPSTPPPVGGSSQPPPATADGGESVPPPATADAPADGSVSAPPRAAPRRRPRPQPALTEEELGIAPKAPTQSGAKTTVMVGLIGFVIIGVLIIGMVIYKGRQESITRLVKPAREAMGMDSLPSLKKANLNFEEVLKISGEPIAVASIAYVKAIMVSQYGMGAEKDAAERALARAEKDADEMSLTYVAKSMLLLKAGKVDEAVELLKDKNDKLGQSPASLVALGDAYMAQGKLEDAGKQYQSARERSGAKEARGLWAMGEFMRQVGRDREAMGNLDSVIRVDGDHVPARLGRAFIRLEQGNTVDLVAAQTDISRLNEHPEQLGPYYTALLDVARVELSRLNGGPPPGISAAAWDMQKILDESKKALGATNPDLGIVQAHLQADSGKNADAVKTLQAVVQKNPARLTAHIALVKTLIADGKYAEAEAAAEKAQTGLGKNLDLAILVGVARREKKDFRGSEDAFKKAFDLARDHPKVQLELARTLAEEKKFPEALKLLGSAIEGTGDKPTLQAEVFCQTAAVLMLKGGDDKLVLQSLDEATKVDNGFAPIVYWRGMASKGKNPAEAKAYFQKYLDKQPKGEFAARATRERDAIK